MADSSRSRADGSPARPCGQFCQDLQSSRLGPTYLELPMSDQSILAPLASLSSALEGLVAAARPSIVSVHSRRSRASGFVWKAGLVVTADEALAEEGDVLVKLADESARPASI